MCLEKMDESTVITGHWQCRVQYGVASDRTVLVSR